MSFESIPYKRVLVTGGAGFIGSATIAALLERQVEVRVLDNLLPQVHGSDPSLSATLGAIKGHVELLVGDVRDSEMLRRALQGQEAVVHLAALTGTGQSMYQGLEYTNVNVGGTAALLDVLTSTSHAIDRVVVASSRSIYGEGKYLRRSDGRIVYPSSRRIADLDAGKFDVLCEVTGEVLEPQPTDEDSRLSPGSVYAVTKLAQEQLIAKLCDGLGIASVALRYQNVYGPGQSLQNPYTGILAVFSRAVLEGREINVFEDGLPVRDFVYISDVVDANLAALCATERSSFSVNVGTGLPTTVTGALQTLARCMGKQPRFHVSGSYRVGDIRCCFADVSRMERLLGIRASTRFEAGCEKFVSWVQQLEKATFDPGTYAASLEEMRSRRLLR